MWMHAQAHNHFWLLLRVLEPHTGSVTSHGSMSFPCLSQCPFDFLELYPEKLSFQLVQLTTSFWNQNSQISTLGLLQKQNRALLKLFSRENIKPQVLMEFKLEGTDYFPSDIGLFPYGCGLTRQQAKYPLPSPRDTSLCTLSLSAFTSSLCHFQQQFTRRVLAIFLSVSHPSPASNGSLKMVRRGEAPHYMLL